MKLFLLLYLMIYGGLHVYVLARLQAAVPLSWPARIAVGRFWSSSSCACPDSPSGAGRPRGAACFLSYVGYLWMGSSFSSS
jgi:hypothetical protein